MSETKGKKATKTAAPKAESKKTETKSAPEKAESGSTSTASTTPASGDSKAGDSKKDGKSARESIGGAKDVHYGYFSSVRTPAYRSGWDAIWGGNDGMAETPRAGRKKAKPRRRPAPITLTLDLEDIPADVRDGLAAIAREQLKKSRVSYDRRDKAGAVDWRIECRIDR